MMHEVRSIPPAPRRARLGPMLAHRWPLLGLGAFLCVVGGLWTWMLFLAAGGKWSDQHRLEQGPVAVAPGTVRAVEAPVVWGGKSWQYVRYEFAWLQGKLPGGSFAAAGTLRPGDAVEVELLPTMPNISRIQGTVLHTASILLQARTWLFACVVPGALALLGWLAGVVQLRRVLVHGDVSVGKVVGVTPVRLVLPEMLRVAYEFRDHRAALRQARHWVRAHSDLGARLVHQMHTGWLEPLPVLHDRRLPQWSRILIPADFLVPSGSGPMEARGPA